MPSVLVPIITSIGAAVGGTVGAFLIMESAFVASALIGVGLLGMAYGAQKRAKEKARAAYNAAQVDRLHNIFTTVGPRELVMGRLRKGGYVPFRGSAGAQKEIFAMVIVLAAHEIDGIEQVYLNGKPYELDDDGWVIGEPYGKQRKAPAWTRYVPSVEGGAVVASGIADGSGVYEITEGFDADSVSCFTYSAPASGEESSYAIPQAFTLAGSTVTTAPGAYVNYTRVVYEQKVRIWWTLAPDDPVADHRLKELFPGLWTDAHLIAGCSYAVVEMHYDETAFQGGGVTTTFQLRGAKLYDPRSGLTEFSENPVLMMRHVYTHPYFGKSTVSAEEDARIVIEANECDAATAYTVDGLEQAEVELYRAAIVLQYGTKASDAFDDLAQAMGGSWQYQGGELFVRAGTYRAPVLTIEEADLISTITDSRGGQSDYPVQIGVHREWANLLNTLSVRIWSDAADYKETPLSPLSPAALVARDGNVLADEVVMPAVTYPPQALHIAGITLRDMRDPLTVKMLLKAQFRRLEVLDSVAVNFPTRYGFVDKPCTIVAMEKLPTGPVWVTCKETSPEIFDLDADFVPGGHADNTSLPQPWDIPTPTPLAITEALRLTGDGVVALEVYVTWPNMNNAFLEVGGGVEVEHLPAGVTDTWTRVRAPGDQRTATLLGLVEGVLYYIRARARTANGAGDWSTMTAYTPLGKRALPANVDWLLIAGDVLSWPAVDDADVTSGGGYKLRVIVGDTVNWAGGTALHDGVITETRYRLPITYPGLVTYMVCAVDSSGNVSATPASVATVGASVAYGNRRMEWPQAPAFSAGVITGGAVDAGVLKADSSSDLFWGDDAALHWRADGDLYWDADTYAQMVYEFFIGAPVAGTVFLDQDIAGSVVTIEVLREQSSAPFWGDDADLFWGDDAAAFWAASASAWEPWPGAVAVGAGEPLFFRVTAAAGTAQGAIAELTPYLDVPTVAEDINSIIVSAAGTRVPLTRTFEEITNIQITRLVYGGSSAVGGAIGDKDPDLGPLIYLTDPAGAYVDGVADVHVRGY